ncbi:hypothetical protein D779_0527 [Imhoffiella purpurea]|uniref:SlyX protein n=2 Tax=Imhoffiella purpurea TaxID=1249627 RepID=W9VJI1_9GAMM|nr:hypothetical protein D779_0527 [Imhoffiella purpurea]
MRQTYQEEDLAQLNLSVLRQQQEIDALRQELQRLKEMMATLVQNAPGAPPVQEHPPHY